MQKQRILVSVVGFSDVERHALNTIFRLSQEREVAYAPWAPLTPPGTKAPSGMAQVALVDGESAEAVLAHAKEMPAGQRLIWVGPDAPEHAWRVLDRPIEWAAVLHDLDAVFAARQADSGLLDLDVTSPSPLDLALDLDMDTAVEPVRRALVVSEDPEERTYLRTRLALAGVVHVDEVVNTEMAIELLSRQAYLCGFFNLDEQHMDVWSLMRVFVQRNPQALALATSELAGPLAGWWRRRRVRRDAHRVGVTALLERPLQPRQISEWLELI
jgi:CheY-like chemotaxis protein